MVNNGVQENTLILKKDLTWIEARLLKVGDEIVAFDEGRVPGVPPRSVDKKWLGLGGRKNRLVHDTIVTEVSTHSIECVEVSLSSGSKLTAGKGQYWLGKSEKDRNLRWYKLGGLRVKQKTTKHFNPWEVETSYNAGWFSGFLSGEGCLLRSSAATASVGFCQVLGVTLDKANSIAKELGLIFNGRLYTDRGEGRKHIWYAESQGGRWKTFEILGRLQPQRLIDNIRWDKIGALKNGDEVEVMRVLPVGIQNVTVISTASNTYFAEGFAMHTLQ